MYINCYKLCNNGVNDINIKLLKIIIIYREILNIYINICLILFIKIIILVSKI